MSNRSLAVALGILLVAPAAHAVPKPGVRRAPLQLFAGFLGELTINRFTCGMDAQGHVCNDPKGSTTVGGGFWPQKPSQYVFGSGTQVAGVIDPASGFGWSGDTTAAFFEDPSGAHENGDKLSLIWNANDASDNSAWPRDAYVPNDTSLYSTVLIGRKSASQQDVWTRYWDGNPGRNAGRPHPLGVLVDERGMAWNFPSGNEDIQYWIFTITNITASKAGFYGSRPDADSLESYGRLFKASNDAAFAVSIPDTGYTITNAYFAYAIDADVDAGGAKQNLTTANLPFNMGVAFKSNWYTDPATSGFVYPPAIFSPPFAPTVGEVGVKYLRSPFIDPGNTSLGQIGLVLYSATVNAGAFGDAANAAQVYRYLSGTLDVSKGDAPCNYNLSSGQTRSQAHICYIPTTPDDIRFFESSGPFTLKPGQSQTIAVALIAAAPVNNPAIAARGPALVFPTGGAFPAQPESLATGSQTLNALDSIFGALTIVGDTNGSGKIEQNEITTVPRSLLGKGLVAQAVFDAKFLLPFPPDAPNFFLIPGDNNVTIVWNPSVSEQVADPYYTVASDPTSTLYDPNYRDIDVQGYRIYRGRTTGEMELIAQFDYAGKEFIDFTGAIPYGNCAPELGVLIQCPPDLLTPSGHAVAIAGDFIQVAPGGRVQLAGVDSNIVILNADTAGTTGGTGGLCKPSKCLPLANNGVPFSFVDRSVKNGFTYFYTVAAFDVNSVKSVGVGYTALEGRPAARTVVPRKNSAQIDAGKVTLTMVGGDGTTLSAAAPSLAGNGIFSGPAAAADGGAVGFPAFLPSIIGGDSVKVVIDSIHAGFGDPDGYGTGGPATYFVRAVGPFPTTAYQIALNVDAISATDSAHHILPGVPTDQTNAGIFGGDSTYRLYPQVTLVAPGAWRTASWGRASINTDPANSDFNGPRWWAGTANETLADPNGLVCSPAAGGCAQADLSRNAGAITGVGIFHVQSYSTVNSFPMRDLEAIGATVYRAADFKVYWGATAGTVDSVVDATHRVKVPFDTRMGPSWGFLNGASFAAIPSGNTPDQNSGVLTWTDIFCTDPAAPLMNTPPDLTAGCPAIAPMQNAAQLSPVVFNAGSFATAATLGATAPTGNGFIFYLNGHFFVMQMAALPSSTVWYARFYAGNITGTAGTYKFQPADVRPAAVPGLTIRATYTSSKIDFATTTDSALSKIHTVPDPYYVTNSFEQSTTSKVLKFVNLPSQCIIRIYSLSGVLVQVLTVNDATGGAETQWNLRNRNQQVVASGVYFYHVETPDGKSKIGRFTLVNYAQ